MNTSIDRRIAALEQKSGDPEERVFGLVTFEDGTGGDPETWATGLDPLMGRGDTAPIDRLVGESWEHFLDRAKRATQHLRCVFYTIRGEEHL